MCIERRTQRRRLLRKDICQRKLKQLTGLKEQMRKGKKKIMRPILQSKIAEIKASLDHEEDCRKMKGKTMTKSEAKKMAGYENIKGWVGILRQ